MEIDALHRDGVSEGLYVVCKRVVSTDTAYETGCDELLACPLSNQQDLCLFHGIPFQEDSIIVHE